MAVTDKDMEGIEVRAGDKIAFVYGIPPIRVEGMLSEREGKLIMPTPNHTPKEATLAQLRYHCGGFWKVGISREEYIAMNVAENEPR